MGARSAAEDSLATTEFRRTFIAYCVQYRRMAAAPIHDLYQGRRLTFEFERTQSRLLEMQSTDYLAGSHTHGTSTDTKTLL